MAKVYVKFNSAVIKEVLVNKDEMTIGRKPNNDIVIDHPTISGFHGKIRKEGDRLMVEDLNSTNGTFLNGHRVKSAYLKDKDQIGIAGHILDFHADENTLTPKAIPDPSLEIPKAAPVAAAPPTSAPAPEKDPAIPAPPPLAKQKEILRESLGLGADGKPLPPTNGANGEADAATAVGVIRIIAGGVNGQTEVHLRELVTYIGTTDQAAIKISGFLAPSLAAAISKRPEGYFLKAVKSGYPKVNGQAIREQIFLENGALIEVGGTNMVFYRSDARKATANGK